MTDERARVEDALRRYVEATGEERRRLATGDNASWQALATAASTGEEASRTSVEIRRLAVERVDGDEATAALDAVVSWEQLGVPFARRLTGPVLLRREGGEWKVADYAVDGVRRSAALRLRVAGVQEVGGVELRARAASLGACAYLVLEVRNDRDRAVRLGGATLGWRVGRRRWRYAAARFGGRSALEPGEQVSTFVGTSRRLPPDAGGLRLAFAARDDGGETLLFDLVVALEATDAAQHVPQPPPRSLPLRTRFDDRARTWLARTVLVGLLAWFAATGDWNWVGALGLSIGGGFLLTAWRVRGSPRALREVGLLAALSLAIGAAGFLLGRG